MTETKIRVAKDKLIAAIRSRCTEAAVAHEERLRKYPEKLESWQSNSIWALRQAEVHIMAGELPLDEYNRAEARVTLPSFPERPKFSEETYDRHIRMLEMCPDDTVSVSTEDFGKYLR